ncbi:hypothetical protein [Pseudovibrio sp. POLY-S9]|uniref:hypothetical protein n=1 Tax=Pseudovibrio sp. POLY-S9 TaxID=1576596 RepID=UPI00070C5672|nr:hypothetical protein [Pseudovibrio sp. POLY-S9]
MPIKNSEDLIDALQRIPAGSLIPKPNAQAPFTVKGWGKRRGERALIYNIPNHQNPHRPHSKGITISEWEVVATYLFEHRQLSRRWFNETLPACAKEGGCNFTTIGGVFEMLGLAEYQGNGLYSANF